MEVDNSEETVAEEEPETTPSEETPTEEPVTPTETPEEPVAELYELPDGRKVDAETLSKEWKDNFYPEYTRKSQALAEKEKGNITTETPENPYADPTYIPKSYEEIIAVAEQRALARIEAKEQEKATQAKAVEDFVTTQITELKTSNPKLDENALFAHAVKYGFQDLKSAYQNMQDMGKIAKTVQTKTVKDIQRRNDPVSTPGKPLGNAPDPSAFQSATDYLRSLKT